MKKMKRKARFEKMVFLKSKSVFLATLLFFAAFLLVYSQSRRDDFESAKDFPRGALIYAQIDDLPAFIKLWDDSKLKENYLESANFKEFANNHLGRKLTSRWREFNAAAGFEIDLETLAKLTENRAAVALYDVGKLEFVFLAPVSDEIFAAAKFWQNKENFTAETLADGTEIYRVQVEADRGRQQQDLIFTHAKNRLIIATNEKLFGQTLDNISGKASQNRIVDEPDFQILSAKIKPNAVTVWLNQTALNEDYYFKRYWLMSETEDLKNIRAGIFDFEITEDKIIEKRRFLLNKPREITPINF